MAPYVKWLRLPLRALGAIERGLGWVRYRIESAIEERGAHAGEFFIDGDDQVAAARRARALGRQA